MILDNNVALLAGVLLPLIGTVVYIRSILRGQSKPQRTTKLLMALITGLSFFALVIAGDSSGVWLALASFVQAVIVFGLSLRFGMGGREKLDIICFVLCSIGLVTWLITGESYVGLAAAIIADFIGIVPALVKTYRLPHTEIVSFYAIDTVASACILFAGAWTVQAIAYPLYLLLANAVFVAIIVWRQRKVGDWIRQMCNRVKRKCRGRLFRQSFL